MPSRRCRRSWVVGADVAESSMPASLADLLMPASSIDLLMPTSSVDLLTPTSPVDFWRLLLATSPGDFWRLLLAASHFEASRNFLRVLFDELCVDDADFSCRLLLTSCFSSLELVYTGICVAPKRRVVNL